jgi:putative transposase
MKGRFTEEQIIGILKEAEGGRVVKEVIRDHGISQDTFYRWRRKFGGLEVSEAKRLRELEDENRRLKQLVAEQSLDIRALKEVVSKKW